MSKLLIVFESKYGQSAKIAHYIADDVVSRRGHTATVLHVVVTDTTTSTTSIEEEEIVSSSDGIIVVAPIYNRRHAEAINAFVRRQVRHLSAIPSALVSVSMAAGSRHLSARRRMERLAHNFLEDTEWRGAKVILCGGAIAYPSYPRGMRLMMKLGAWYLGESTNTAQVQELTDWRSLDAEACAWLDEVDERKRPPSAVR